MVFTAVGSAMGRWSERRPSSGRSQFVVGSVLLGCLFLASTAPSPLYRVYQAEWHFSSTMLTVVFSVYAATVMLALRISGPLSDRVGRRQLGVSALATVLAALVVFSLARGIWWIFAARALQGLGVGAGSAALTASVVDGGVDGTTGGAATAATVASNLGVGFGALGSGFVSEYVADPTVSLYAILAAMFAVALIAARHLPSVPREQRAGHVMRFGLGVPDGTGTRFSLYASGLGMAWAVGGFYLALGPSIAASIGDPSALEGAAVVSLLGFVGAAVAIASRRWRERRQIGIGSGLLVGGLLLVVLAALVRSEALFSSGSVVLAGGWGLVNIGTFRALIALSGSANRGGAMSAIYLVSYVAFSLPTVLAGICSDHFGLRSTTVAFGATAACITSVTAATILLVTRRRAVRALPQPVGSERADVAGLQATTPEGT